MKAKRRVLAALVAIVMMINLLLPLYNTDNVLAKDKHEHRDVVIQQTQEDNVNAEPPHVNKDEKGPEINTAKIYSLAKDQNGNVKDFNSISTSVNINNYKYVIMEEAFVLEFNVVDIANTNEDTPSGIKSIELVDQFDNVLFKTSDANVKNEEDGTTTYLFTVNNKFAVNPLNILIKDNLDNETKKKLSEINSNLCDGISYLEDGVEVDEKYTNDIDYNNQKWFKDDGVIKFDVYTLCKKLNKYQIIDKKNDNEQVLKTYNSCDSAKVNTSQDISISGLKEGKHEIIVRAEYYDDNTNKLTVDKSYDIYVENIDPTVSLTIDTEFEIINN